MTGHQYDVSECVWQNNAETNISLQIPNSVKSIGDRVFQNDSKLGEVEFESDSILESIRAFSFAGTRIAYIEVPKTVRVIGKGAFSGCLSLAVLDFEDGSQIEVIDDEAFCDARLSSVDIPETVVRIGNKCFARCKCLMSLSFAKQTKLKELGDEFASDSKLIRFEVPESLGTAKKSSFLGINIFEFIFPSVTCIPFACFENINVQKLVVPQSVRVITAGSFAHCIALSTLEFQPNSKTYLIEKGAFCGTSVTQVLFPASLVTIEASAFQSVSRLKFIQFEKNSVLKSIGDCAFMGSMLDVSTVNLPNSVESVGAKAFATYGKNRSLSFGETSSLVKLGPLWLKRPIFLSFPVSFLRTMRKLCFDLDTNGHRMAVFR